MVDEDDDGELIRVEAERWSWLWVAAFAANMVANVGRLVTGGATEVSVRIAQHDAWRDERREFADQVRSDLEQLPEASAVQA